MSKLYIYDASSSIDRSQAAGRFSGSSSVHTLGASSISDLHLKLSQLVVQNRKFDRLLFQTHGNSGAIFFAGGAIDASAMATNFSKYRVLFPTRTKVYFDGCNVADGKDGWAFLAATGSALLTSGGGVAMGYTSLGFGMPGSLPLVGGHTIHVWGDLRLIDFKSGGIESQRLDAGDGMLVLMKMATILNGF